MKMITVIRKNDYSDDHQNHNNTGINCGVLGGDVFDIVLQQTISLLLNTLQSSRLKSLQRKTFYSPLFEEEIKTPITIEANMANRIKNLFGKGYFTKKSEANPAAVATKKNSPNLFVTNLNLPSSQNGFSSTNMTIYKILKLVKKNPSFGSSNRGFGRFFLILRLTGRRILNHIIYATKEKISPVSCLPAGSPHGEAVSKAGIMKHVSDIINKGDHHNHSNKGNIIYR